jgi:chromosome partitioning protein
MINVKNAAEHFGLTGPRLKQILKEHDISFIKEQNGYVKIPSESMSFLNRIRKIPYEKKIVTIAIEKGGSGKTVITINVALTAARYGRKTLVIDLDPECCASLFLKPENIEWASLGSIYEVIEHDKQIIDFTAPSRFDGVDFLPGKILIRKLDRSLIDQNPKNILRKRMKNLMEYYDLILFDLPPTFSKLCAAAYLTSDIIICPVNSDMFSVESMHLTKDDIEEACEEFDAPVPQMYVLKNRFSADNKKRKASKSTAAELNKDFADIILPFQIRAGACIENCLNEGKTLFDAGKEAGIEEIRSAFFELFLLISGSDPETRGIK